MMIWSEIRGRLELYRWYIGCGRNWEISGFAKENYKRMAREIGGDEGEEEEAWFVLIKEEVFFSKQDP